MFRKDKHQAGDVVRFVQGIDSYSREYVVKENGNLVRQTPKPKGKAAVKAAKRARHGK